MSNQPSKEYIKLTLKNTFNVTQIVTVLCYDFAPDFHTEGETHDFWEFVYVDRGEIFYNADSKRGRLTQGEMVFHAPGEFHRHECDGKHSASVFILTFECRSPAMKYYSGRSVKVPPELASLMKRLIEECTSNFAISQYPLSPLPESPLGGQQLVRIYLEEFLIRMMRSEEKKRSSNVVFTSKQTLENKLAEEMCEYLSEHIRDRVTLDSLSERFHFGKSHLCDIFKKAQGDTIVQYHLKLKIAEAKRMLHEEKLTITEISEQLGFESPAYFSRIFTKLSGVSPRAFRSKLINKASVYLEKEKKLK